MSSTYLYLHWPPNTRYSILSGLLIYPITILNTIYTKNMFINVLIIFVGKSANIVMKKIRKSMFGIETIQSFITSRYYVTLFNDIYCCIFLVGNIWKIEIDSNNHFHVFAFYTIKQFINQLRQYVSHFEVLRFSQPTVNWKIQKVDWMVEIFTFQ